MAKAPIRIATRESPLALWQANFVRKALAPLVQDRTVELLPLTTTGDRFLQDRLQALGGKGLFVKELEEALLDGRADLAVHSMKDMPSTLPTGLSITAICPRDNPLDTLLSLHYDSLEQLPKAAVVGTASLRRQFQLLALRPDLQIKTLRGNINTRIKKLADGEFDAIVLAAAGLERLEITVGKQALLPEQQMLPACAQGAMGIESRSDDPSILALVQTLNHAETALCVAAERKLNATLGGSCQVPIAVHCRYLDEAQVLIQAKLADPTAKRILQGQRSGSAETALQLAEELAQELLQNGAAEILAHSGH